MGTWGWFFSGPSAAAELLAGAVQVGRQPAGWALFHAPVPAGGAAESAALAGFDGPLVSASVWDDDACMATGWIGRQSRWQWTFGELPIPADMPELPGGEVTGESDEELARRASATAAIIAGWAADAGLPAVEPAGLATLLEGGHIPAGEGLWGLLAAIGVPVEWLPDPEPGPAPIPLIADVVDRGWRAIRIDHRSHGWTQSVLAEELEEWGEPAAYLVRQGLVHLSTDPPVQVIGTPSRLEFLPDGRYATSRDEDTIRDRGATGDWIEVPADRTDVASVSAWVRERVGGTGAPPSPSRPVLQFELPGGESRPAWHWTMARPPRLTAKLVTRADLFDQLAVLADWLDRLRTAVLVPAMAAYAAAGVRTYIDPHDPIEGPPYGLVVYTAGWSVRNRPRFGAGDDRGWQRMLTKLRDGQLRQIDVRAQVLTGAGKTSHPHCEIRLGAMLRDQFFPEPHDPLPAEHPAEFEVDVPHPVLDKIGRDDLVAEVTSLISEAARTFHATDGYVRDGVRWNTTPEQAQALWQLH